MSIYKDNSRVKLLLSYCYTEEEKLKFLKNRIYIFLRGEKGTLFSVSQIAETLGLSDFEGRTRVYKAVQLLLQDETTNVKESNDKTRVVYPREKQYVW